MMSTSPLANQLEFDFDSHEDDDWLVSEPEEVQTIYTDGGCWPNPGAGGWGFVCAESGVERSGGDPSTTNNRMEMQAALEAIRYFRSLPDRPSKLLIVSDSLYLINGCVSCMSRWRASGFSRGEKPLKNIDLWKQLGEAMAGITVKFKWVRGHNGDKYNERADELAASGFRKRFTF